VRKGTCTKKVGSLGVLHPSVLEAFGLKDPASTVEMDIELLLELETSA